MNQKIRKALEKRADKKGELASDIGYPSYPVYEAFRAGAEWAFLVTEAQNYVNELTALGFEETHAKMQNARQVLETALEGK